MSPGLSSYPSFRTACSTAPISAPAERSMAERGAPAPLSKGEVLRRRDSSSSEMRSTPAFSRVMSRPEARPRDSPRSRRMAAREESLQLSRPPTLVTLPAAPQRREARVSAAPRPRVSEQAAKTGVLPAFSTGPFSSSASSQGRRLPSESQRMIPLAPAAMADSISCSRKPSSARVASRASKNTVPQSPAQRRICSSSRAGSLSGFTPLRYSMPEADTGTDTVRTPRGELFSSPAASFASPASRPTETAGAARRSRVPRVRTSSAASSPREGEGS